MKEVPRHKHQGRRERALGRTESDKRGDTTKKKKKRKGEPAPFSVPRSGNNAARDATEATECSYPAESWCRGSSRTRTGSTARGSRPTAWRI